MQKYSKILKKMEKLDCKVFLNEPMNRHCSFKIGGKVDIFVDIHTEHSLQEIIKILQNENINYRIIGNGSNILFPDENMDFVILHLTGSFCEIKRSITDENLIICGAGAKLSALCKFALDNSLSGLEFAWGIPGTVGGAIYMNAGAFSGEVSQVLQSCSFMDNDLKISTLPNADLDFSYRHSRFENSNDTILQATFSLKKSNRLSILEKMHYFSSQRKSKQPLNFPSAGSVFKRPGNCSAGELIEQCNLKGKSIGNAMISLKHAGFIINTGNASAKDVRSLIKYVQNCVKEKRGINLHCEIQLWHN